MADTESKQKFYQPTVTFVMISYNDQKIITDCLSSIRKQNYPQNLIKIIMVDGGSIDATIRIAEKYNVEVISRPDLRDAPDVRAGIALTSARSELVMFVSADNRLMEDDLLSSGIHALADDEIVACETLRYGFRATDPILSRYFALIGGADPIAIGLGKADRGPFDCNNWHGQGTVEDCGNHLKVSMPMESSKIPTLGANGFLIKRAFLEKTNLASSALHIDMCVELILKGFNKFAFLKHQHIVHFLDMDLLSFLKRRLLYANMYSPAKTARLYSVFHRSDTLKLLSLIFFNLTLVVPLLRSFRGYLYKRDIAWFLHPIVSFSFTVGYSVFFLKKLTSQFKIKI